MVFASYIDEILIITNGVIISLINKVDINQWIIIIAEAGEISEVIEDW